MVSLKILIMDIIIMITVIMMMMITKKNKCNSNIRGKTDSQ